MTTAILPTITIGTRPRAGDAAPDFTLKNTADQDVTLSSFRGTSNVLVAFFPMAFTSVCTAELCAFGDDYSAFEGQDVVVLPVSTDAIPSLKAFKKQSGLKVELLSDFKRQASAAFDVLFADAFFANRAYFLIDRQGIVRWAHVEDSPGKMRENAEILAEVAKLG
ncbi:MAG: redoxin domain-containing protein [Gemmatimonadota bacterium]|jgi:peroxiredoxin (alkyl hydroperoxide reductase subunit C)